MSAGLGKIIVRLRKEQGISQEQLSKGLCSLVALSRIERGIKRPEKLLFDGLISRLGKDSRKWQLIVEEQEKYLFYKRTYMDYLVKAKQWKRLEDTLQEYKKMKKTNENLHNQYMCFVMTISYKERNQYDAVICECIKGLKETKVVIQIENPILDEIYSYMELSLLCLIGEALYYERRQSIEQIYQYWKQLFQYIKKKCTDWEYQFSFYIKAQYYLARITYEEEKYEESSVYLESSIEKIKEKKSIYYLQEILQLIKEWKHKKELSWFLFSIEEVDALLETLKEWEKESIYLEGKEHLIKPYNSVYSINEVIKNVRYTLNRTQESLIGGGKGEKEIGSQSGLSEIENGKRNPRKSTANYYLSQLGIEGKGEAFQLSLREDDFELQELQWEIDFNIINHKEDKASKLLNELKAQIDMSNTCNEQYVKQIERLIKRQKEKVSCKEMIEEILQLLSLTIPEIDKKISEENEFGLLTKEELTLFMDIGCEYHRNGEYDKALKYYKKVESYLKERYKLPGGKLYKVVLHNITQINGLLGNYGEAMKKSRQCIFLEWLYSESNLYYQSLYNLGWCYGRLYLEEKDCQKKNEYKKCCNKYFQQSYILARLYNHKEIQDLIDEKRKKWILN